MSDLETDREAVEPCQFELGLYSAMSDHNVKRQRQKTTAVEAKKDFTVQTGETVHGVVLIIQPTAEMSPQQAGHKPFLPGTCIYLMYIQVPGKNSLYPLHNSYLCACTGGNLYPLINSIGTFNLPRSRVENFISRI